MNGRCDFCPRTGRLAICVCPLKHQVGVWVCAEKHEPDLNSVEISCRVCYETPENLVRPLYDTANRGYVQPLPDGGWALTGPRYLLDVYADQYLDPEGECAHDCDDDREQSAPAAFAALRRVLLIHDVSRHGDGNCVACFTALGNHLRWPCPTVKAITRALEAN